MKADLVVSSAEAGLPRAALDDVRATRGVESAVALTSTALGPSLGVGDEVVRRRRSSLAERAAVWTSGSRADRWARYTAPRSRSASIVPLTRHAKVGESVKVMLGDGTRTRARVVAIYKRSARLRRCAARAATSSPAHQSSPLVDTILVARATTRRRRRRRLQSLASRYPGPARQHASVARKRGRRGSRDESLARAAVRRDHLRVHVDRRRQHARDDRAAAGPRARTASSAAVRRTARSVRWLAGKQRSSSPSG